MKNIFLNEQKVGMLLQKRTDTRGVGISSMRKSIYIPPYNHTHRFHSLPLATHTSCSPHPLSTPIYSMHPLSTIFINYFNLYKVQSMDDNCGEWVECMCVASGCGEQEAGVVSRRRVWLVGEGGIYGCGCEEVYRFPHTTYLYSSCTCICSFLQQHPTFCSFFKMFFLYRDAAAKKNRYKRSRDK